MRDIKKVYEAIKRLLDAEEKESLENSASFWAPESFPYGLTMWVNGHIVPDSRSEKSVRIYAHLCGCSPKEMRETFIQDNR